MMFSIGKRNISELVKYFGALYQTMIKMHPKISRMYTINVRFELKLSCKCEFFIDRIYISDF